MGKAQVKKKTQGWRHNPVRVPDSHLGSGKAEGRADPQKEKQMLPILNKLKSPEYADRTWACAAISNLIQNDAATRRLFQGKNVVGELIERLSDSVDEVVVEASGALRNLAIDGGRELCGEMANKGIISHLGVLIGKISNTITSVLSTETMNSDDNLQARKHLLSLSENVILLLWCLAEASPKTLANVNAMGCEGLLIMILEAREKLGLGVSLAAAQTLFALSQDNFPFRKSLIIHPTALESLITIAQEDHIPAENAQKAKEASRKSKSNKAVAEPAAEADDLPDGRALLRRVLACGILRNIIRVGSRADEKVGINALTASTILPLINGLLDVKLEDVCTRVDKLVKEIPSDVKILDRNAKTDHKSISEVALERIERNLSTIVAALEVLTNICAGLEDEEDIAAETLEEGGAAAEVEIEEDVDAAMDEDEIDDEGLISMDREPGAELEMETFDSGVKLNPGATLSHLLTNLHLPERLTLLSCPVSLSFPPASTVPSIHPPTTSILSILHLHALEAMNNLLLTAVASISAADRSAAAQIVASVPVQGLWDSLFAIIQLIGSEPQALQMKGQEMRMEVLEMTLGCVWGTIKINPSVVNVQEQQVQILMDSINVVKDEITKTRVVETLSTIAMRESISNAENQSISQHLVQGLTSTSPSPSAEMLVSLLNAVIDIYSDETRSYDSVFVENCYLQVLSGIVGKVRAEVKKIDKRRERNLRTRGDEVYENLVAFIKYRRSLQK
ncbi:hypothetical protein I314_06198 [Cryptococcus bacillisporus CA1873]|uniref:SYO1-like TPR repeats domain-containing protein n=1 Tax=Cryptococcus bacillisporus CA1873 TaxID=1296111 RepID=A0ABR5B2W2_CRYGA|nr:hypothetical protein I314_06198 [Cryptococcus bacillisporus CA1873]|eukprot:KIR57936.1 hypothetical protein I314_06198 [Cryptococcus gattii CA1873]